MGSQVHAKCQCGFETDVLVGGGMMNFTTTCYFPCLCNVCKNIVQINLLEKPSKCPDCGMPDPIPYDAPQLLECPGDYTVAEWNIDEYLGRNLRLTNGRYRCPKCGKMRLQFVDGGLCWD